jgi:hypothetical protein
MSATGTTTDDKGEDHHMGKREKTEGFRREFEAVIHEARRISADVGRQVERILKAGREHPLSRTEAAKLLTNVVETLQENGKKRGRTPAGMEGNVSALVERIIESRERIEGLKADAGDGGKPVRANATGPGIELLSMHSVEAGPLHPTPWFHETKVPMYHGYVRTIDLALWNRNDRLDIHIRQFRQEYGRDPDRDELLNIMLSKAGLLGAEEDEFKILKLANSIAVNGVRKPPVLDVNGTPLDGNRRIAACLLILGSDDFDAEQKKRVEYLYVWKLTEHADNDDRRAVVVSLNFEDDCKEEWRAYIKARKVYEDWQAMMLREPRAGTERIREMQAELSKRYAFGSDTSQVKRFIKMYELAEEYKEYHISQRDRDEFEAEHRTDRDFEYFDELSKGNRAGVAYQLEQDETLKHMVYDLLYDSKFSSWKVVRDLKYLDDEVKAGLKQAWEMKPTNDDELEEVQDFVERVLVAGRNRSKENRVGNANIWINTFVKRLRGVPIETLQEELEPATKSKLRDALQIAVQIMDYEPEGDDEEEGE